jgi:RNA polymerase sigma-70 factor (sigma-E family)
MTGCDLVAAARTADLGRSGGGGTDTETAVTAMPVSRSFERSFEGLYRLAYRVAFRILGDRPEAEDVAQETLARAALRWSKLEARPEGWVSRVASNLAVDRYRRRTRQRHVQSGPIGVVDERMGERADIVAALRLLPRRQREVVVLRYLADLSESDVAQALGCSVGSVKTHASRGLGALRQRLGAPPESHGDDVRAS